MTKLFFIVSGMLLDPVLIFSVGLVGGFVSGLLGIGCGIIITPVLIEFGIPSLTVISTQLCHAVGSNFSNFLSYRRKQDVDFQMAMYILIGGFLGIFCEWAILKYSADAGFIFNKFVYVYVAISLTLGSVMFSQSIKLMSKTTKPLVNSSVAMRRWMLYIPLHKIFVRSRAEMSVFVPIFVGILAGITVASLGGGNNLFIAPIITYLIGRISPVVRGTTALTGGVITTVVAFVYAERGYNCDFPLVVILFVGAAIGSWCGINLSYNIKRHYVNMIASCVIFMMAIHMIFRLLYDQSQIQMQYTLQDLRHSTLFQFAGCDTMTYTALCILLICIFAVLSDKILQKITKRVVKHKKTEKR
jgi:uncharacterized membrane protein YfcA